jgi:hypothetical protein
MEKIHIRFGDFSKNDTEVICFEAIVDEHIVKILLPTATYPSCQFLARFVEETAFLVIGKITGRGKCGEVFLSNITYKAPLKYDKELQNYIADFSVPTKRNRLSDIKVPKWFNR